MRSPTFWHTGKSSNLLAKKTIDVKSTMPSLLNLDVQSAIFKVTRYLFDLKDL